MTRLRGRASLMVVATISFILLVVIYHILSNEIDEMSSGKVGARLRAEDVYPPGELTDGLQGAAKRQQDGQMTGDLINSRSRL